MTNTPTVKERLDPNSPHYEPELARLREAAIKEFENAQPKTRSSKKVTR